MLVLFSYNMIYSEMQYARKSFIIINRPVEKTAVKQNSTFTPHTTTPLEKRLSLASL